MARKKQDSSIQVDENVNVYEGKILQYYDEFLETQMFTDIKDDFLKCVLYIRARLNIDIEKLNVNIIKRLFNQYIYISVNSNVNPTVDIFFMLVNIEKENIKDILNREEAEQVFDYMARQCQAFIIHDMSNMGQMSKKFIAQSVYGMNDKRTNINIYEPKIQLSNKELAAQIGILPDQTITQHDE